ncbi:MAG TPA: hypothetical protein VGD68_14930 [Streptosporangiaceae bacterium]
MTDSGSGRRRWPMAGRGTAPAIRAARRHIRAAEAGRNQVASRLGPGPRYRPPGHREFLAE